MDTGGGWFLLPAGVRADSGLLFWTGLVQFTGARTVTSARTAVLAVGIETGGGRPPEEAGVLAPELPNAARVRHSRT